MRNCACGGKMEEFTAKTPDGVPYSYYRCKKCSEEIVDMKQLHEVAEKYRLLKTYHVKLAMWGLSLGLRIPKDIVEKYGLGQKKEVILVPEKEGIRIIPG